jgi:sugar-specific transcriptional regulator TrmB
MVASISALDSLRSIGLNKYERNLLVALLSKGTSTAGELADISKVPRSRCYDVLESLAVKGFVVVQPGKPLRYVAIKPSEALERAKKKIMDDAVEMQNRMEKMKNSDTIKELEKIYTDTFKVSRPEELTGTLRSRGSVMSQIESMIKTAKKSVNISMTEQSLIEFAENYSGLVKRTASSGIKLKIAAPLTKRTELFMKELSKHADVRAVNNPSRFVIADDEQLLLGLSDEDVHHTQDMAFWTQSAHATNSVAPLFDMLWEQGAPVK